MYDLKDRVLLLTGATGGIGKAIAEHFQELGARALLLDLSDSKTSELAHALDPTGKRIAGMKYDASRPQDATAAVEACLRHFGQIDFVIPAAAIYEEHGFAEMSDDDWRRTMTVNLDGVFYICRRAVPVMRENSAIVLIASEAGHRGATPRHAHYGTSKGAMLGLMRSLALELAPAIRVNSISPGTIDTPMVAELLRQRGEGLISATPMKRLGTPREVATAAAFLCSGAASYMTGQVLHPNGGSYIGG